MKKLHVSMLLALLCSMPAFAGDGDNAQAQDLEEKVNAPGIFARAGSAVSDKYEAVSKGWAKFCNGHKKSIAIAKFSAIDVGVYCAASKVNVVGGSERVSNALQYVFADQDQANLAVLSAIAQGLHRTKVVWGVYKVNDEQFSKIDKVASVACFTVADFIENIIVAKAKGLAKGHIINPINAKVAEKYGINMHANKAFNGIVDVSSWIVLRRALEAGAPASVRFVTSSLASKQSTSK